MIDYHKINSIEDLQKAQKSIRSQLNAKGSQVSNRFNGLKEYYTPVNLFASGLRSVSRSVPLDEMLLNWVIKLKQRLIK